MRQPDALPTHAQGTYRVERQVMECKAARAITHGKVAPDPREQIFYGEFDGRGQKCGLAEIIGE